MKYTLIIILISFTCCTPIDMKMSSRYNRIDKKNEKCGAWLEYFPNGKLKRCQCYKNGKLNGKSISYFENGKIERTAGYLNGQLNGIVKIYNDAGFLMQKAKYSKGATVYVRLMNPY